ncbi:TetR/AcrR family transcriptional regulator [Cellulomonas sp. NS3]|uniref:TetR/AcrR family transcriptional regulator n=1 Tax=Cellulomonas sp. NS3 TaxID=2973977 RepID=UPI00216219F0|nr:TetR/AcrR family transcriptional regulator [Cellulomonas sp. NS3]
MTTTALPKGRRTRDAVLTRGVELACRVGLGGLTIGGLADEVGMSKSGMYAHFGSKQALQLAVLDAAAEEFATTVIVPALRAPRGVPRVRALAELWIRCGLERQPGGCLFVKASTELDEQDGPVRDRLREQHQQLAQSIARMVAGGVTEGQLRPDTDAEQFATDLHGVMLAMYHGYRLLSDPAAERHARTAIDRLLDAARAESARGNADASSGARGGGAPAAAAADPAVTASA